MGYHEAERTATLLIDEGPFAGAEVTVRTDIVLGVYEDLGLLLRADGEEGPADKLARYRALTELVGTEILRGWNVVDHRDRPRPVTPEGLRRIAPEFLAEIIGLYFGALGRAASPLAAGSSSDSGAGEPTRKGRRRRPS